MSRRTFLRHSGALAAAGAAAPTLSAVTARGALAHPGHSPIEDTPRGAPEEPGLFGRGPEDRGRSADAPGRLRRQRPASRRRLLGKPRNDDIPDIPVVTSDASIPLNLIPYHAVPARLRALQASDRISVEIIGETVLGRPMYLVVATSKMTDAEWGRWQQLSDLRTENPAAAIAAMRRGDYDTWKSPLFVNNNIHGNEWEGTDGSLNTLDRLAFAEDEETLELLDEHVLAFVISNNPDGRVAGTRANANGFDLNRDYITASQPESQVVRAQLTRYNALTMLDQHGYVQCTLIEPTTGPHGENYEYDLYIRNALRNALAMEQAVIGLGETRAGVTCTHPDGRPRIRIPYRDNLSGWDDWPPIFTPMYAMFHGSLGHTIEFPLNPRGVSNVADRHDRTRINTRVVEATNWSNFRYANARRFPLLADQLELYRRGQEGEGARPIDDELSLSLAARGVTQGYQIDNSETFADQTYPRAYVIPVDDAQRSGAAAARIVEHLLDNDVRVDRATREFTLAGTRYPAGSYVVDMRQAKRGLANTILSTGRDVTPNYPTMYDISAWSPGDLWGATVVRVADGDLPSTLVRVSSAVASGDLVPGRRPLYGLTVTSLAGVQAVNRLLEKQVDLSRLPDGRFVVPGSAHGVVREVADDYGVTFDNLPPAQHRDAVAARRLRVGTSAPFDEVFALAKMGFDLRSVTHTGFNDGTYTWGDVDALYVSTTAFNPLSLGSEQQQRFADWLEAGGAVVGRGGNGVLFNSRAGLLPVSATAGRSDANGIVAVVNDPASPITGRALPRSFVSSPRVFNVPENAEVRVDQRLADQDFFLAGHWRDSAPFAARPIVVSGKARGANVALFGTEPLYRAHPEGLHPQVAEALWQAGR